MTEWKAGACNGVLAWMPCTPFAAGTQKEVGGVQLHAQSSGQLQLGVSEHVHLPACCWLLMTCNVHMPAYA